MTTVQGKTEQQIAEQQYRDGYEYDRPEAVDSTGGFPHEELKQNRGTAEIAASETTLRADFRPRERNHCGQYDPSDTIADPRFKTRSEKYARLWKVNAGLDRHRVCGRSDEEMGKVNRDTEDRRRGVHATANGLDLHPSAVDEATEIAARVKANRFNYYGGFGAYRLAICSHVARRDITDERAYQELLDTWQLDTEKVEQATEKIAEIVE